MRKTFTILTVACLGGACPAWATARPHHTHPVHVVARTVRPPTALNLQYIAYRPDHRSSSSLDVTPYAVGAADRLPTRAADYFGRGGVASIGYQPGAASPLVGVHEINTAFSSQPTSIGGVAGGNVTIHF